MQNITHYRVWSLAGPIILSNVSVPLVGAVDTAVMGHLAHPQFIGAVALGALIFSFLYWGFGFLRMGTTGFIARAFGADEKKELHDIILRAIILALILGLFIVIMGRPLIRFGLYCLQSEVLVESLAWDYSVIRVLSAPATLLIYVFTGIFIGLHNTRHAFVLQMVLNLTNIVLDLWFVPVLGFGIQGVAWATLIAEYSAVATGIWLLRKPLKAALSDVNWRRVLHYQAMKHMMTINSHIFIRTLCLVFSFAFFTAQSAKLGTVILAANTVLIHLQSIMAYALDGFAHSAEALAGSAYGAKNRKQFRRAVALTTFWSGLASALVAVCYALFGTTILGWFTDIPEVIDMAEHYLPWMIAAPLLAFAAFQLDGIFIGTGFTVAMRNAMIASTVGYLALVLILQTAWGNHGLFLALSLFMILRAVTLGYYYPRIVEAIDES